MAGIMYEEERAGPTSFRISPFTLLKLRKEAKGKRLTVNALVNQIVLGHTEFHSFSAAAGMAPLPKALLIQMVDGCDEGQLQKLAGSMAKNLVDLVYMKGSKCNLESLLKTLLLWSDHCGFMSRDFIQDGQRVITIRHNMGKAWSSLIMGSAQTCIAELPDARVGFEKTDDMVIVRVGEAAHPAARFSYSAS